MGKIESLLTSVVRPYSFIVTDGEGVQYCGDVYVSQHTAAAVSAKEREQFLKNVLKNLLKIIKTCF